MSEIIQNLDADITNVSSFADEVENKSHKILNPFFVKRDIHINNEFKNIDTFKNKDIYYNFNKLYILCLRNNESLNNNFYNKNISIENLLEFKEKLTLIKGNMKMINSIVHRKFINIVDNSYLDMFNHKNYELEENELIIFMINIEEENIKLYLKQYEGMFDIGDIFKLKSINDYYCEDKNVKFNLTRIINNISENDYWKRYYNCKLNLSLKAIHLSSAITKFSFKKSPIKRN